MDITVCIGSSCHLKGANRIVGQLKGLIEKNGLEDKVSLCGAFCMGNCTNGVSVTLDQKLFSLSPNDTNSFFETQVLERIKI